MAESPLRYTMVIQRPPVNHFVLSVQDFGVMPTRNQIQTALDAGQSINFPSKRAAFLLKNFWFRQ